MEAEDPTQARLKRAKEYGDGYCSGFYQGKHPVEECFANDDTEDYRNGFKRGFAARRLLETGSDSERQVQEQLYEEVDHMFRHCPNPGPHLGEETWEKWKTLQGRVREIGQRSYEDHILEVYRHLSDYAKFNNKRSNEELSALSVLQEGVIRRFARILSD